MAGEDGCTYGQVSRSELVALEKLINKEKDDYKTDKKHQQDVNMQLFNENKSVVQVIHSIQLAIVERISKSEKRIAVLGAIMGIISSSVTTLLLKVFKIV